MKEALGENGSSGGGRGDAGSVDDPLGVNCQDDSKEDASSLSSVQGRLCVGFILLKAAEVC